MRGSPFDGSALSGRGRQGLTQPHGLNALSEGVISVVGVHPCNVPGCVEIPIDTEVAASAVKSPVCKREAWVSPPAGRTNFGRWCVTIGDLDSASVPAGLVFQLPSDLCEARVQDAPVQPGFLPDLAARALSRATSAGRHAFNVQVLNGNVRERAREHRRELVYVVAP